MDGMVNAHSRMIVRSHHVTRRVPFAEEQLDWVSHGPTPLGLGSATYVFMKCLESYHD